MILIQELGKLEEDGNVNGKNTQNKFKANKVPFNKYKKRSSKKIQG